MLSVFIDTEGANLSSLDTVDSTVVVIDDVKLVEDDVTELYDLLLIGRGGVVRLDVWSDTSDSMN